MIYETPALEIFSVIGDPIMDSFGDRSTIRLWDMLLED